MTDSSMQTEQTQYFLGCVPLRPGVMSIAILQAIYAGMRVYLAMNSEERDVSFYLDCTGHWIQLGAAVLLALGLVMEYPPLFLPWVGLTILIPASFIANLTLNLFIFNLPGVWWLIVREGIPVIVTLYVIQIVYILYCEMVTAKQDSCDSERAMSSLDTEYGTGNIVFLDPSSNSVVGSISPSLSDSPPAYDTLVSATKERQAQ